MTEPPDVHGELDADAADTTPEPVPWRFDPIVVLCVVLTLTGVVVALVFLLKDSTIGTLTQSTTDCGSVLNPSSQPDTVSDAYCDLALTHDTACATIALICAVAMATAGALTARWQRFRGAWGRSR